MRPRGCFGLAASGGGTAFGNSKAGVEQPSSRRLRQSNGSSAHLDSNRQEAFGLNTFEKESQRIAGMALCNSTEFDPSDISAEANSLP